MAFAAVISLHNTMMRHEGRSDWMLSAIGPQIEELALTVKFLKEFL